MTELTIVAARDLEVWRIGRSPDPWAWIGWEWAIHGRFGGRWDDPHGKFRTLYAGSNLFACLLEVLACFRPDPVLASDMADILSDVEDERHFPTATAGQVPRAWVKPRVAASGILSGPFCAVTTSESIATLRPKFVRQARMLGLHDFDAAGLKDSRARALTQSVAVHLHDQTHVYGVQFASRHGDDLPLWAIFERPNDGPRPKCLTPTAFHELDADDSDVQRAFSVLGLSWSPGGQSTGDSDPTSPGSAVPLPLVQADEDEALASFFPDGEPTPATPLGAAWLWWGALEDPTHFRRALSRLSVNPRVWGDFTGAAAALGRLAIMQHPIECRRPGQTARRRPFECPVAVMKTAR